MAGDGPARVHWEIRPALRMAEFFEIAYSGQAGQSRDTESFHCGARRSR